MIKMTYALSYLHENAVFLELTFFVDNIRVNVSDPRMSPIYDILVKHDTRGDLGLANCVTGFARLDNIERKDNLRNCFKELEEKGYLDNNSLDQELNECSLDFSEQFECSADYLEGTCEVPRPRP